MTPPDIDVLFREYHQPLVRYLTRRLGDRDLAEELAQETFVRASRQESIVNARSWLFAVATNLVRDDARKSARQERQLAQFGAESAVSVEQPSLEPSDRTMAARRALDCLVEKDREALLMKEEGLNYQEIADALGLSVGSVGTTLARARRRLVEAFAQMNGGAAPLNIAGGTHAAS